jgi:hypothetical protein
MKQFVRLKESGKKVYVKRFKEKFFIAEKEAIVDCKSRTLYTGGVLGIREEVNDYIGRDKATGKLYVFHYFPRRDLELAIAEVIDNKENLEAIEKERELERRSYPK